MKLRKSSREESAAPQLAATELTEETIRSLFEAASDVRIHYYDRTAGPSPDNPLLIYCDGLIDGKRLNELLLVQLHELQDGAANGIGGELANRLQELPKEGLAEELIRGVFEGSLLLFFEEPHRILSLPMAGQPKRDPSESTTEISVKGPRDGFTEELNTNIALVRKRLRTPTLAVKTFVIGKRTKTRVALLYMTDITDPQLVAEAERRLNGIDVDGILASRQLEEAIGDDSYSLFPLVDDSGRPDYAANSLLRGRLAILIDGSPMVLLAPSTIATLIKSPEDLHSPYFFVIFERMLRLVGLTLSMLLPGFWVSVTAFNLDQVPFPLLATIVVSRLGLPLPGPLDLFLMLAMFELFREAGLRLPKAVGQTVAVVGGLIVGESAISAGLTSPTSLVVSAVTAVATFTLVNQSLSAAVTVARFFILILSCLLGMFGFFIGVFLLVLYLARLRSFGVPFLSPLSPPDFRLWMSFVLTLPWKLKERRPSLLNPLDDTSKGGGRS